MGERIDSTPKEVYPIIAEYAKGKVFCDLGSGHGAILRAMDRIAKKVIGVESCKDISVFNSEFEDSQKKYKIYTHDFTKNLPEANVYYMWVGDPKGRYNAIKDKLKGKTLLIGAHKGTREPGWVLPNSNVYFTKKTSTGNGEFSIGVFFHE